MKTEKIRKTGANLIDDMSRDDIYMNYAAGRLSTARRLLVATQMGLNAETRREVEDYESLGGAYVELGKETGLSDGFLSRALSAACNSEIVEANDNAASDPLHALTAFMGMKLEDVKWKKLGGGVSVCKLFDKTDAERIFLLKAKPGASIPEHSHTGEEWTLIMQGAYKVGDTPYVAGDLHIEDEDCQHQPVIQDGEDCICLAMTEGPLRFKGLIPRMLQPIAGI